VRFSPGSGLGGHWTQKKAPYYLRPDKSLTAYRGRPIVCSGGVVKEIEGRRFGPPKKRNEKKAFKGGRTVMLRHPDRIGRNTEGGGKHHLCVLLHADTETKGIIAGGRTNKRSSGDAKRPFPCLTKGIPQDKRALYGPEKRDPTRGRPVPRREI